MKIDMKKVYWMIEQSKWLEEDDRHTDAFCSGVKTAHSALKSQLKQYKEEND